MFKRLILLVTVAAMLFVMLVVMAAPALASDQTKGFAKDKKGKLDLCKKEEPKKNCILLTTTL